MCDFGISAIAAGIALTATSAVLGTVSAIQEGKAKQAQYDYQAQVAERNAQIARNNAQMERQTGLNEARTQRMKMLQTIGHQKNLLAGNNVDVSFGSALDIYEDTAMFGELDALNLQYNAEKNARNYDTQAQNFDNDAILARYAGQNARRASTMNALSTGLGGLGSIGLQVANPLGNGKSLLDIAKNKNDGKPTS